MMIFQLVERLHGMQRVGGSNPPSSIIYLLNMNIADKFSRKLRDVRISVTDRCNFRCTYCMPKEVYDVNYNFFKKTEILSFEEIIRLVKILASLGVKKVRLTGGEPLLRKNTHVLVKHIKEIKGIADISMTTNGVLLSEKNALLLKESGLNRLTISLDSIDPIRFQEISGTNYHPNDVLSGIHNAKKVGFENIKINMVVKKDINHEDILPMLDKFSDTGCIVRFIEFMDVGNVSLVVKIVISLSMLFLKTILKVILMKISEKDIIKIVSNNNNFREEVLVPIGEDASVLYPQQDSYLVSTTDTMVFRTHFNKDITPYELGYIAAASNISDLSAMGATPAFALINLTIDKPTKEYIKEITRGYNKIFKSLVFFC